MDHPSDNNNGFKDIEKKLDEIPELMSELIDEELSQMREESEQMREESEQMREELYKLYDLINVPKITKNKEIWVKLVNNLKNINERLGSFDYSDYIEWRRSISGDVGVLSGSILIPTENSDSYD